MRSKTGTTEQRRVPPALMWAGVLLLAALVLWAGVHLALGAAAARWPNEAGTELWADGSLLLDVSGLSEGYFQASTAMPGGNRLKLRVTKDGQKLTYDLNTDGRYEVFPLQFGDGYYDIALYRNISGKEYATAGRLGVNVVLSEPEVCFLYPNQYVNYTPETEAVAKAEELCGALGENEAYEEICKYMGKSFVYDYVKAITVKPGMLPDINESFEKKMGVCQDLSAIMCCMLRTQGVPARLVIGYADNNYHAWVEADFGGKSVFFDPTAAVNGIARVKEYTTERWY